MAALPDGSEVDIRVVRKRNMRRVILHAERDGDFWISMPMQASDADAMRVIEDNKEWLLEKKKEAESHRNSDSVFYMGRQCTVSYVEQAQPAVDFDGSTFTIAGPTRDFADSYFDWWWEREAYNVYIRYVYDWYEKLRDRGMPFPSISVRKLKTMWGSCSAHNGTIRLSAALLTQPEEQIEYVVLHEMAHLLYPDHALGFQDFLTEQMPDWRQRREKLHMR